MMIGATKNIEIVAFETRKAFEHRTVPKSLLRSLYSVYNPNLDEVDRFLDLAADIFPEGNCGLASVYLQYQLGEGNVLGGRYEREPHSFLGIGKLVIDITADQLGGPPVYVGYLQPPWSVV